jgi:hypothetical protein
MKNGQDFIEHDQARMEARRAILNLQHKDADEFGLVPYDIVMLVLNIPGFDLPSVLYLREKYKRLLVLTDIARTWELTAAQSMGLTSCDAVWGVSSGEAGEMYEASRNLIAQSAGEVAVRRLIIDEPRRDLEMVRGVRRLQALCGLDPVDMDYIGVPGLRHSVVGITEPGEVVTSASSMRLHTDDATWRQQVLILRTCSHPAVRRLGVGAVTRAQNIVEAVNRYNNNRFLGVTHVDNIAAIKSNEKCGLRVESHRRFVFVD